MIRLPCAVLLFLTVGGFGFLSAQDLIPVEDTEAEDASVEGLEEVQLSDDSEDGQLPAGMENEIENEIGRLKGVEIKPDEIIRPSMFPPEIIAELKRGDLDRTARVKAEWEFLNANVEDASDEKTISEILSQLVLFLHSNPESEFAADGLLLKATLDSRVEDYKSAVVDLLKFVYEYPESKLHSQAKRSLTDIINREMKRKLKPVLTKIAAGPDAGSDIGENFERLADLLKKLTERTGGFFYEPVLREYEEFFYRYPDYRNSDELQMLLGKLHLKNKKYTASMLSFRKLLALYPSSALRARAQRLIGDIFGDSLKNNSKSGSAYQKVIDGYPSSDEAPLAYARMAKLEERQKHYRLAVDVYGKIIKHYPGGDAAVNAFNAKARLLKKELKRPDDAIKVYGRLADMFKGTPAAADALENAAETASKLKEYAWAAEIYVRLAQECPESPKAPSALYSGARIYEKELENLDKAVEIYNQLAVQYPDHKLAKKAKSRVKSITKR